MEVFNINLEIERMVLSMTVYRAAFDLIFCQMFYVMHWPLTSTFPHLRCDVGLEEGEYWKKLSLCYSIVYYYNGAQRYEQFLQVDWLYWALILFGFDRWLPSASATSVFMVLYAVWYIKKFVFAYIFSLYLLVTWAWWDWPGWLTIVLQCCDTVGWVIWPVKSSDL